MVDTYFWLILAAAGAGLINAVAGGGTLLTFPALLAALGGSADAAVMATATSTLALVPGSIGGMWGYRREMRGQGRWIALLLAPSLAGSLVGTMAVVTWPGSFQMLIPWLILAATLLFALQPYIGSIAGLGRPHLPASTAGVASVVFLQLLVAMYGGYFGAGIGILMLACLAMLGLDDVHAMNGIKSLLGTAINGLSAVIFILYDWVHWPMALAMAGGALAGGYFGASTARRLDRNLVRRLVVVIGFSLAAYYFYRKYAV